MINLSELRGGLLVLAGLVIFVLALAIVTPGLPGELLLQSLRLHILAGGFALAVIMLVAGLRWRALMFLLCLGAAGVHGVLPLLDMQARRNASVAGAQATTLDVLSYNVLTGNRRSREVVQFIVEAAPDVAVIMETPGVSDYLDEIAAVLPYRLGCDDPNGDTCDLSIHSKYPIIEGSIRRLSPFQNERFLLARIEKDGVPVTIVGVHFSKPYFDQASSMETEQLVRILTGVEGDVILTGDFNAAPWSDTVEYLAEEVGLIPGPSHPATWPVRAGPLGVPIDNMFTRGNARILEIAAGEDSFGSNHRYLRATVGFYPAR
jgi:endonuclease/exonuclease/phosphatase (EEP) superfamily protein YafD